MRFAVFLISVLLAGIASAAEIYKWTDAKGRTHYSDRPPPADVTAERRDLPREAERPAEPAAEVDAAAAEAARLCTQARDNLRLLQENTNVAMDLDGDGTPETLDEDTRLIQIRLAERAVEQRCRAPEGAG